MPGRRNRIALNPLLRKGGVHQRTRSADRQQDRQQLESMLDEWRELEDEDDFETSNQVEYEVSK